MNAVHGFLTKAGVFEDGVGIVPALIDGKEAFESGVVPVDVEWDELTIIELCGIQLVHPPIICSFAVVIKLPALGDVSEAVEKTRPLLVVPHQVSRLLIATCLHEDQDGDGTCRFRRLSESMFLIQIMALF